MPNPTIEEVDLPKGSLVARCFTRIDYADAYRTKLPAGLFKDVDSLARSIFESSPWWARALMALRDGIVAVIGLKTSNWDDFSDEDIKLQPGSSVRGFQVFERTEDEILLGLDDSHLDFRVSILRSAEGEDSRAVISTIVRFNNLLGRAYFVPVKPLHKIIVRAIMRRAIQMRASEEAR